MARKSNWNTINPADPATYPARGRIVLAQLQRRSTTQIVKRWLVTLSPDNAGWFAADDFDRLKDSWEVIAWSNQSIAKLKRAPLDAGTRHILKRRLADLKKTAAAKGTTLDAWDENRESQAGKTHFELGCWLYFYAKHTRLAAHPEARADCLKRIFMAGLTNPGYAFFTAFDFGERDFDNCLEQGDSADVLDLLRKELATDETGNLARAFDYFGWKH